MLDTIKQYINAETPEFNQFYQNYIQDVHDYSIGVEVSGLQKADVLSIDKLITKLYAEMLRT
jgi:hypothetical protein